MWRRLLGLAHETPVAAKLSTHRPFLKRDTERLRWTGNGSFVLPVDNPGIRVEPNFISVEEEARIVHEAEQVIKHHGYAYGGDTRAHALGRDGCIEATMEDVVNNVRVTGRMERPDLVNAGQLEMPPWGYGEDFDSAAMPQCIGFIASRIANCGHFHVGAPRDLTINGREQSFFVCCCLWHVCCALPTV